MKNERGRRPAGGLKDLLGSFIIAWSMYSRVPMPQIQWTKERMRYTMCFFPLIGVLIGGLIGAFFYLSEGLGAGTLWTALTGTALPLFMTGGIHMDGFLDTTDARRSFLPKEKKLEILKDPHLGAFAVIYTFAYMLLYAGASCEFAARAEESARLLPVLFMTMERAFSGLSVVTFPQAKKQGLAAGFGGAAKKRTDSLVLLLWMLICLVTGAAAARMGCRGAVVLAVVLLMTHLAVFIWYYRMSVKQFGGVTGIWPDAFCRFANWPV